MYGTEKCGITSLLLIIAKISILSDKVNITNVVHVSLYWEWFTRYNLDID